MRRKVIQLAGKTHVVSLPSYWIKNQGIKKGDELQIEVNDKKILISTEKGIVERKLVLHLTGSEEFVRRRISTAYKKGIDELEISVTKPELITAIQEGLKSLLGFEIINRGLISCTIKNIAQPADESIETLLRRVFFIIQEMGVVVGLLCERYNPTLLQQLKSLEYLTDRLTNVCKRVLNKQSFNTVNNNLLYCIIWESEKIADEYLHLGNTVRNADKRIKMIIIETNEYFKLFHEIFASFSEEKGIHLTKQKHDLEKKANILIHEYPETIHHVINIINKVHEIAGPYYAMIL